jgi:hypothetical protein
LGQIPSPARRATYLTYPAGRRGKWIVLLVAIFLAGSASSDAGKFEKAHDEAPPSPEPEPEEVAAA